MREITKAEMSIIITLVKCPEIDYNANSLAKVIGITPMGALKILKRLEKESIFKFKRVGRAKIYRINTENPYARRHVSLILSREALHAPARIIRWIQEFKKIDNAEIIILFGSVLVKENPNDIDVLLITDKKRFPKLQKELDELQRASIKKIHPIYQTFNDIAENIRKRHKPILNAIKGVIVMGEEKFIEVYNESRKE